MNRIYQGRASRLELLDDTKKAPAVLETFDSKALTNQTNPLWKHHEIFQDAVNYYLVALASLAQGTEEAKEELSDNERLASDLITRTTESWTQFRGNTTDRHLHRSLSTWLNFSGGESIQDSFDLILKDNPSTPETRRLALQLILDRCGGDSAIQQGGREYLPKLCVAQTDNGKPYSGSYDFDKIAIAAAKGKEQVAELLHSEASTTDLQNLSNEMDISWAGIKCKPNEVLTGEELKKRLTEACKFLGKRFSSPQTIAENELVSNQPKVVKALEDLIPQVANLDEALSLSVNKGGNISWDLVHATYLFKVFPSSITGAILALSIKKPGTKKKSSTTTGPNFSALGDDPLKLARGERGFVFPAFTALPTWNPKSSGQPTWKEFDIAAFKEALKSLNQFNQKTAERSAQEKNLFGKITILLGGSKPKGWKPAQTEGGESEAEPTALDATLLQRAQELETRLTSELADTVVAEKTSNLSFNGQCYPHRDGQWWISNASLRGFCDLTEKWNKLAEKAGERLTEEELENVVKDYQREEKNKKQVGSLPFLLALCHQDYWSLWKKDNDPKQDDDPTYNRFLFKIAALHQEVRDYQRSKEPINLTPAEPRQSRRLYMFSDISGKEKVSFKEEGVFETTLAYFAKGECRKQRTRIHYQAPRLKRDQLLGGEESRWLQPMTKALGLELPKAAPKFESAVSLMPDFDRKGNTRFLLNFPKTIDETWLKTQIGKDAIWSGQFNGVKDKNLHLHWPQSKPNTKQAKNSPWWKNETNITNGFTTLSVDLGQRTAGAWALLKVTCWKPKTKRPLQSLGHDGEREWFAEVLRTGMLRLPGEDQIVSRKLHDRETLKPIKGTQKFARELAGSAGRNADSKEHDEALKLAERLGATDPANWVGKERHTKSYPQQNDSLLTLANRRLSRLATFHRWSCTETALDDEKKDARTKTRIVAALLAELEHWDDSEVTKWHQELLAQHHYLAELFPQSNNEEKPPPKGQKSTLGKRKKIADSWDEKKKKLWDDNFSPTHFELFSKKASTRFNSYRNELLTLLLELANRTAPLSGEVWVWEDREKQKEEDPSYGYLAWAPTIQPKAPKIRGQRGLSMARLEQLESLRTLFLRYNRSMDKIAGKQSKIGFGFSHDAGEPAEILLKKIDRMKEQRINQTAHLILAQALGVQLKHHDNADRQHRKEQDIHGEYEIITDKHSNKRQPVDFIVIENLDRYLTSQGRAPSENRRLMKWAHRAVRDKLKMLAEEPFGIPVVEAPAAYSSRFCARSSQPGSRCEERKSLNEKEDSYLFEQFLKRSQKAPTLGRKDNRPLYQELLAQFKKLEDHNKDRKETKKKPRSLVLPKTGGPLFLPAVSGPITQADANAAINVGLRAMAAPDSLHLIHKLRTERERKTNTIIPVLKNAREKAAYDKSNDIKAVTSFSAKTNTAKNPNFFHLSKEAQSKYEFDQATFTVKESTQHLISGVAMATTTDDLVLQRIVAINNKRLTKWGCALDKHLQIDPNDDIPM